MTAYGGLLVATQTLVAVGVIELDGPVDGIVLLWHLFVWDPWFLVIGLLLGVAARRYQRGTRHRR